MSVLRPRQLCNLIFVVVCVCKTHFSTPRQRENHIRVHPNHYPVYVRKFQVLCQHMLRIQPFPGCACGEWFKTVNEQVVHHHAVCQFDACSPINDQFYKALDPSRQPSRPPSRSSRPHGIVSITGVENSMSFIKSYFSFVQLLPEACICGLVYKSEDLLKQHIAAKRHSEDMNRQHLLVKRRPETHAEAKFGKSYFVRRRHC